MPGLGDYKKGKKFTLKSGNNPAFKMMAQKSPITESPYKKPDFGKIMKKVGETAVGALTGGLDAVYGSGKIIPSGSARLIKKEKDEKTIETGDAKVSKLLGMSSKTVTKKPK